MNENIILFGGVGTIILMVLPLGLLVSNGLDIMNPPCLQAVGAEYACHSVQYSFIAMIVIGASLIPACLIIERIRKYSIAKGVSSK